MKREKQRIQQFSLKSFFVAKIVRFWSSSCSSSSILLQRTGHSLSIMVVMVLTNNSNEQTRLPPLLQHESPIFSLCSDNKVHCVPRWSPWYKQGPKTVHYSDVVMSTMVSQITSALIVCSNVCSGTDQRKHQSSVSLVFVRGIHRWSVNSPHKGPVTRKMFPFDDVIIKKQYPWCKNEKKRTSPASEKSAVISFSYMTWINSAR